MSGLVSRAIYGKEAFLCFLYLLPAIGHWKYERSLAKLDPVVVSWLTGIAFLGIGVYLFVRGRKIERRDALLLFDPTTRTFEQFDSPDHFLGTSVKQWSYLSIPLALAMFLRS